jgi:hypothetical protein
MKERSGGEVGETFRGNVKENETIIKQLMF